MKLYAEIDLSIINVIIHADAMQTKVLKMLKFSQLSYTSILYPFIFTTVWPAYIYLYLKHCASMVRGKISVVISDFPVKFIHAQYMRGDLSLVYFWTLNMCVELGMIKCV